MKTLTLILSSVLSLLITSHAHAHEAGADLDKILYDKEKYFQIIDETSAPTFDLMDAHGNAVRLEDFSDKIVVFNFVYASCVDVCPLHAEKMASVQNMINISPMVDMVQFISITTDPAQDTFEVMNSYGPAHGLDPVNWTFLTTRPGKADDSTRVLANAYRMKFTETDDGAQIHGVVTHIIDRGGRFAAKFHGLKFNKTNLIIYINGLINSPHNN